MSQEQEISCCIRCGRDTKNKSGVCARCNGFKRLFASDEAKGRKARPSVIIGGSPIDDEIERDATGDEAYHGGSCRDDI